MKQRDLGLPASAPSKFVSTFPASVMRSDNVVSTFVTFLAACALERSASSCANSLSQMCVASRSNTCSQNENMQSEFRNIISFNNGSFAFTRRVRIKFRLVCAALKTQVSKQQKAHVGNVLVVGGGGLNKQEIVLSGEFFPIGERDGALVLQVRLVAHEDADRRVPHLPPQQVQPAHTSIQFNTNSTMPFYYMQNEV